MVCDKAAILEIILLIKNILKIVQYMIPVVLIIMSMLDILRSIVSDSTEIKKVMTKVSKRFMACICVFLVLPTLNILMQMLGRQNIEMGQCWKDATKENIAIKKVEEEEIEKTKALKDQKTSLQITNDIDYGIKTRHSIFKNKVKNNTMIPIKNFPYYNQGTDPWRSVPFCSGSTIHSSGCGATSLSMIFSGLTGQDANPKKVANWICQNGHLGGAMPDSMATNSALLKHFHVNGTSLWKRGDSPSKSYVKKRMKEAVNQGQALLVLVPGHFVAVVKGKKKDFYLLDPGSRALVGEYTADNLYSILYDYKNRCSNGGNCGLKAAWAYTKG